MEFQQLYFLMVPCLLITMHTVLAWWLVATMGIATVFNFVCFYHWNEMIGEINARVPEEEQVPISIVELIGKPNKFARMRRGRIGNVLRLHERLFPSSTRRRAYQLSLAIVILFAASAMALLLFLGVRPVTR
jgi:hypothetical protein